jgi:hypothetical protein
VQPSPLTSTPSYLVGPSTPRINVLPSTIHLDSQGRSPVPPVEGIPEEREIEALLMAQRARTPMAIAVAQDYTEPPIKVPRAFVVLGWFWLTDAWVSAADCKVLIPSWSPRSCGRASSRPSPDA